MTQMRVQIPIGDRGSGSAVKQRDRNDERCTCTYQERESSNNRNAGGVNDVVSQARGDIDLS
jgi:hypothetical protein